MSLGIVPRLVKDVISVTPDTLTPEHLGEAQALGDLVFGDVLVAVLRLADHEFAQLERLSVSVSNVLVR